jgi:spermidine synthase
MTTTDQFDIIASDPLDVFVKGTAALYTVEYFEAVKRHLNPGGFFTLYVPLYETDERTIRSEVATFFEAFPEGTIWANLREGMGYDLVFLGQVGPLRIPVDEIAARLASPEYGRVAESLRDIQFNSVVDLFSTYLGRKQDMAPWIAGADINHDRDLRLQYLAGWGINSDMQDQLYRKMAVYRHAPSNLFQGSPQTVQLVINGIAATGR